MKRIVILVSILAWGVLQTTKDAALPIHSFELLTDFDILTRICNPVSGAMYDPVSEPTSRMRFNKKLNHTQSRSNGIELKT